MRLLAASPEAVIVGFTRSHPLRSTLARKPARLQGFAEFLFTRRTVISACVCESLGALFLCFEACVFWV